MEPPEWYAQLDPGIRFAVRVLHAHGIETGQSCQGGEGHAYDHPTVDLFGLGNGADAFAALHYLETYGLHVRDLSLLWTVHRGLPTENFWRLTFVETAEDRADEQPMFTWDYQATGMNRNKLPTNDKTADITERATEMATRYGEAIVEIHSVLADDTYSDTGKVMRARLVIAGLDQPDERKLTDG